MSAPPGNAASALDTPLLKRAFEDWQKVASGGNTHDFIRDLLELPKSDLKILNHTLAQQALLPNLQILTVRGGHIIARDQERSREVMFVDKPQGMVEVQDLKKRTKSGATAIDVDHSPKPLFDAQHKIKPSDVHQGEAINDCRLQARLATLAKADPGAIIKMIRDNHNGTYTVTFPGEPKRPQTINAPTPWERATFSSGGAEWTLVVGKAYRQMTKQVFGPPRSALSIDGLLTGKAEAILVFYDWQKCTAKTEAQKKYCFPTTIGNVSKQIDEHDKKPMILPREDARRAISEALANHMTIDTSFNGSLLKPWTRSHVAHDNKGHRVNLQGGHYYSLLAFNKQTDTVTLRNPWAKNFSPERHKFVGDGTLTMSFRQFARVADAIDVEKTAKTP